MNREIKFRGKRVDNGEWIYGYLCTSIEYLGDKNPKLSIQESGYFRQVIPETVGQYTGLKDKNGKEIYEGDIIKSLCQVFLEDDQDALISEVYYHESYAAFYLLASNRDCENDDYEIDEPLEQFIHNYDILEAIGNIYENPELLEVENE